jgi:hypothetical protein
MRDSSGKNPCAIGALIGYNGYLGYQIFLELSGRKSKFGAGFNGALNGLKGGIPWAMAGCLIGSGFGEAEAAPLDLEPSETWGNPDTLEDHFARHGGDFDAQDSSDYANQASDFFQQSQEDGLPTKIDSDGTIRVYDPETNTFGSYNPDGTTKTFFKPTSPDYWNSQPGSPPWIP